MRKDRKELYKRPYMVVKRGLDLCLALLLLPFAAILVGLSALGIKLETPGPAFFIQERPGYKGEIFRIYKLRSMCMETEREGKPLTDMERMTGVGRFVRACSIDELPQLVNILKGEMSFIGPRPLLVQYLPLYSKEQMRRHDVLPGISGWAQVNGRNEISWEQKFERDVWYVDHVSFGLDAKILWMTICNVLRRQGINAGSQNTMADFEGSSQE